MPFNNTDFDWTVIGAGPAGIAAVGKLIDFQVSPNKIAWLDPAFSAGDFGTKWRHVSSNTKVHLFLKYLLSCDAFHYADCQEDFGIHGINPDHTCELHWMADPLQWVTERLQQQVTVIKNYVQEIKFYKRQWQIALADNNYINSKNVVLALGAEPKTLALAGVETIPLELGFNREILPTLCTNTDTVAVFGSSHSAVLIMRVLLEACDVKQVINFYRSPLCYAVDFGDWILFDDTGLKGTTAEWARVHLDGSETEKLMRVLASNENLQHHLPACTKAICAVGFQNRNIPIAGLADLTYNPHNGIIAPGLFGVGIGFPEAKIDRYGTLEYRVGLWKFMDYLTHILPLWLRYHA